MEYALETRLFLLSVLPGHNKYMLLNVVDEKGKPDLKFIGIGHVTDPGASGHLAALKLGADDTVVIDEIMKVITHLSTNGENKNF